MNLVYAIIKHLFVENNWKQQPSLSTTLRPYRDVHSFSSPDPSETNSLYVCHYVAMKGRS